MKYQRLSLNCPLPPTLVYCRYLNPLFQNQHPLILLLSLFSKNTFTHQAKINKHPSGQILLYFCSLFKALSLHRDSLEFSLKAIYHTLYTYSPQVLSSPSPQIEENYLSLQGNIFSKIYFPQVKKGGEEGYKNINIFYLVCAFLLNFFLSKHGKTVVIILFQFTWVFFFIADICDKKCAQT